MAGEDGGQTSPLTEPVVDTGRHGTTKAFLSLAHRLGIPVLGVLGLFITFAGLFGLPILGLVLRESNISILMAVIISLIGWGGIFLTMFAHSVDYR
jgi:hypothetical protein